eukprot:4143278-Amphidinium_carterae.1
MTRRIFLSAESDVEPTSTANREGREQLVTCSKGGVCGVPEQLSACSTGLEVPGQTCSAVV